jgi:hypothetical protein
MTSILVWVLISVGGYGSNQITYSPHMADLESCQRLQQAAKEATAHPYTSRTQCVQIRVPK